MDKCCTNCGKSKLLAEFSQDRKRSDGLSLYCRTCRRDVRKRYYAANKEKVLARNDAWRIVNQKRVNARQRRRSRAHAVEEKARTYRWREENRARYNALARKWRANNKSKVAETNRRQRVKNPQQKLEHNAKRRARKMAANAEIVYRREVHRRDGGCCYLCGNSVAFKDMHADHDIPLSRGGAHTQDNVRCACASCNLRKKDKTAVEFLQLVGGV